jgi:hypothetical protein
MDSDDDDQDVIDMDTKHNYYQEFKIYRMNKIEDMKAEPLAHEKKYQGDKIFENKHLLPLI